MATQVGTSLAEGQSTKRSSLFNGSNYTYWKARMKIFIQALDYDMWSIIVNGPHTPTKIIEGVESTKSEKEWDEVDKKMAQLNTKAVGYKIPTAEVLKKDSARTPTGAGLRRQLQLPVSSVRTPTGAGLRT